MINLIQVRSDFACGPELWRIKSCWWPGESSATTRPASWIELISACFELVLVLSAECSKFVLASLTWHELLSPWLEEGQGLHAGLLQKHLGQNQSIRYSPFIWPRLATASFVDDS